MTREEAIKIISAFIPSCITEADEAFGVAINALKQPEVRHGKWVIGEMDVLGAPIHCSECGWGSAHADQNKWMKYPGHRWCGSCGAKMDGKEPD